MIICQHNIAVKEEYFSNYFEADRHYENAYNLANQYLKGSHKITK